MVITHTGKKSCAKYTYIYINIYFTCTCTHCLRDRDRDPFDLLGYFYFFE